MVKTFVLDTNVLIHDPDAIMAFEDNRIIIPMTVIEELDDLKRGTDERSVSARAVSRRLNELRVHGKLSDGIKLENGGFLKVELEHAGQPSYNFVASKADHRILNLALELQKKGDAHIIFISK